MRRYNLCLLGFGNVGRALARLLAEKEADLRALYGIEYRITGVATRRLGWLADPEGLDWQTPVSTTIPAPENVNEWLAAARADVLFEVSSLDALSGQPAIGHLRAALEYGAHAITANKGPIVHAYRELRDLAAARGKGFRFEATVMDGAPIFSLFRETLPAARLLRFRGILNSTTNAILSELGTGSSFEQAVWRAQEIGIAETDPSADIDGWDATVKVVALATVLMDVPLHPSEVQREGIRGITPEMAQAAVAAGTPYKLVCRAERRDGGVFASVGPERVPLADPLSAVSGSSSTVRFDLDVMPGISVTAHEPGPETTAYGLLADFIDLARERPRSSGV